MKFDPDKLLEDAMAPFLAGMKGRKFRIEDQPEAVRKELMTVEEVADLLEITPQAVRKQCRLGQLKAKKFPPETGRWFVFRSALLDS